jgi:hypothetical protein
LVVGSAPEASLPQRFDQSWTVATVNASQTTAAALGCHIPDLTLFGAAVMKGKPVNLEAQEALRGLRTKTAIGFEGRRHYSATRFKLAAIGYSYDSFYFMPPAMRLRIISDAIGEEVQHKAKPSNGVFLALLCLRMGSTAAVMTGFSLTKAGHAYNEKERARRHVDEDRIVLMKAIARGAPIFTADPAFSRESGVPLDQNAAAAA